MAVSLKSSKKTSASLPPAAPIAAMWVQSGYLEGSAVMETSVHSLAVTRVDAELPR